MQKTLGLSLVEIHSYCYSDAAAVGAFACCSSPGVVSKKVPGSGGWRMETKPPTDRLAESGEEKEMVMGVSRLEMKATARAAAAAASLTM